MPGGDIRTHEVTFCSRVSKWADSIFEKDSDLPFKRSEIEESKSIKRKRSDLRVYGSRGNVILAGEVKMPGTVEGRTPFNSNLIEDAYLKASNIGAQFFFTWNVNRLVLFDAKRWEVPLPERRVKDYELDLDLESADDVSRPEVEERIKQFLSEFFDDLAAIVAGKKPDWGLAPDEFFVRAFESHISWPVKLTAEFLWAKSASDKIFDAHLQEWMGKEQGWMFARNDPKGWRSIIDRAARTLCYVFSNRLLFYESVRTKFTELKAISVPPKESSPLTLYTHFQKCFQKAVEATGDYETLFYPFEAKDWAGPHIFGHKDSGDAWRSVIQNLAPFNFKLIPTDILGGIFKRIIDPEERHKFGQHYTNEDLVDVVNAFCIRKAEDTVLDPACGSGSFLVRAYQRKSILNPSHSHQDRIAEIFGADISLFAAHLSTLNLAARDIQHEENYPRIRRASWFEVAEAVEKKKDFCELPTGLRGERKPGSIPLPKLAAVVGNPPYVRQEQISKRGKGVKHMHAKEDLQEFCTQLWPGLRLTGRSDLHCYFWPTATRFLAPKGWFGFLVSSSWLDVEYGFALQGWVLTNFKIHAILESNAEPWFEDARVKSCAVILQRCEEEAERDANLVKFVRLDVPLNAILGERPDESSRQKAAEKFRDLIARCKESKATPQYRVIVKKQKDLWDDGLRAGRLFELQKQRNAMERATASDSNSDDEDSENEESAHVTDFEAIAASGYGGGKWGKYLRAPNLYFEIMERFKERFVPLGEIATIRFGVKSGCDDFFMPRDVSAKFLEDYSNLDWNNAPLHTACKRSEVESGKVKLVEAGDGTVHPIEEEYLAPEVHSPMMVRRPIVRTADCDRLILKVSEAMSDLKGTHVQKYLRFGETTTFASKKSKAVPVAQRSSCRTRNPWYDLTGTNPGLFLWPMIQQYRHVVPANPDSLTCNKRLFDVHPINLNQREQETLTAIVNSTIAALFKFYYGRWAGTEGAMDTDVIDVNLLELPDPRNVAPAVAAKLRDAFTRLCQRDTRGMVEEEFMECRSPERAQKLAEKPVGLPTELTMRDRRDLDLAVFELLGVSSAAEREKLCDQLYYETANHFRQIRVVEIQKQEQRTKTEGREFRTDELAADVWDSVTDADKQPLAGWLAAQVGVAMAVTVPDGHASLPDITDMLAANSVFFRVTHAGKVKVEELTLPTRSHAEIVYTLSQRGFRGALELPGEAQAAATLRGKLYERLAEISAKALQLSHSRTSDEKKAADLANLLQHWLIHGKPQRKT